MQTFSKYGIKALKLGKINGEKHLFFDIAHFFLRLNLAKKLIKKSLFLEQRT